MKYLFSMFVALLIVIFLGGMAFWFIGWQKYSASEVNFSFRYPLNWSVCEEFYPNLKEYFVHVDDEKINCEEGQLGNKGAPGISIYSGGITTDKKDLKTFLESEEAKSIAYETNGGLPIAPGFRWRFREYSGTFFGKTNTSIARVSGLSDAYSTYIMLDSGYIYEIKIKGELNITHRLIVFSLGFR